ncbi:MAG: hypothetical protein WBB40_06305 [Psychrobacter alimentarius]
MKDYKLLIAGLILLLILCTVLFTWLWVNNRKNINPLPIMAGENEPKVIAGNDSEMPTSDSTLHIQAEKSLQVALDEVIVRFESRYPSIKVETSYVPSRTLLTLPDNSSNNEENSDFIVSTDMIISNSSLPKKRLAPLQAELKAAQDKINQNEADTSQTAEDNKDSINEDSAETETAQTTHTDTRILNSYSYALKDDQMLEGVILTDNTAAINFRNFLLSSVGQDILKKHDYNNIEGYKNSVNDLFSPTTSLEKPSNDTSVDVSDALSNSES